MSEVKTALTETEWKRLQTFLPLTATIENATTMDLCVMADRSRHALAALALYGQPFGFTREDLETLDDAIYAIHGPKMDGLHPGVEHLLGDLKCRIEGLLPTEEK